MSWVAVVSPNCNKAAPPQFHQAHPTINKAYHVFLLFTFSVFKAAQVETRPEKGLITLGLITLVIISLFLYIISYFAETFTWDGHAIKFKKQASKTKKSRQRPYESINSIQQNFNKRKHLPEYVSTRKC